MEHWLRCRYGRDATRIGDSCGKFLWSRQRCSGARWEVGRASLTLRVILDVLVPAALTAAFDLGQKYEIFRVLPVNPLIERSLGRYSLLLCIASGIFSGLWFDDQRRSFGIRWFTGSVLVSLLAASPFIVAPFASFGPSPEVEAIIARFAYLIFSASIGLLIGGLWSLIAERIHKA